MGVDVIYIDKEPAILFALKSFFDKSSDVIRSFGYTEVDDIIENTSTNFNGAIVCDYVNTKYGIKTISLLRSSFPLAKLFVFTVKVTEYTTKMLLEHMQVQHVVSKYSSLEILMSKIKSEIGSKFRFDGFDPSFDIPNLTIKEREIVELIKTGASSKVIAEVTQKSFHTINNQKKHLLVKYDCKNTSELVHKLGLFDFVKC